MSMNPVTETKKAETKNTSEEATKDVSTMLGTNEGTEKGNEENTQEETSKSVQESKQQVKSYTGQDEHKNEMAQILAQTEKVNKQLAYFHKHKLFKVYNSIPQLLWFNLLKGAAFGLGSVLGATVVLSALIYLLAQIEFIPFIGEWVSAILEVVKTKNSD